MRPIGEIAALALAGLAATAHAQAADLSLGGLRQDTSQPVEVSADELRVDQGAGTAEATGHVTIGQGDMRLSAKRVLVDYAEEGGDRHIASLHATGGVTLVNGADAAEADEAVYKLDAGEVVMTGDVVLTRGDSAISGQRLVIDLGEGTGVMQGQVRTILPGGGGQ